MAGAEVTDNGTTTYQYSVNNASNPKTYCITATVGAPNPSAEADASGFGNYAGPGGSASLTRVTSGGHDGSAFMRQSWTAGQTAVSAFGPSLAVPSLSQNAAYSLGVWVRSSKSQRLNVSIEWYTVSDGFAGLSYGTPVSVPANTWTRLTNVNTTSPATTAKAVVFVRNYNNGSGADGTVWANTDTFDIDGILFTQGTTLYSFADGTTTDWVWNGATHNSTSSGPAS